jgi:ACT domain-containing protein
MRKMIAESLTEFLKESEVLNESLKSTIDSFLQNPKDPKQANTLISQAFAKQFNAQEKTKRYIMSLSLEDKNKILSQCTKKLEDSTIGVLKIFRNNEGKLVVGGTKVSGGASQAIKG